MKNTKLLIFILSIHFFCFAQNENELITTSSNLKYKIITHGSGIKPIVTDRVTFHYKGTLQDGTVFDDSYKRGTPLESLLSAMIKGLSEGITLMPIGSKYIFYIPANLAYGSQGSGKLIKPNSNVIFEIELLKVNDIGIQNSSKTTDNQNNISLFDNKYYRKLAVQNYKQKNYADAISNSEKAIALMPKDTISLGLRGICKGELKDYKGAIEDFTAVINMLGNKANTFYFRRGVIYEMQNKYAEALIDYDKMVQLKPDFKPAIEGVERVKKIVFIAPPKQAEERDPNRPFMKLIRITTDEIKVCLKNWHEINNKMKDVKDQSITNSAYSDLLMDAITERNKIYAIIKNRSKELEAFNDPTWPTFKAAYRGNLVSLGIEEKYLKDF